MMNLKKTLAVVLSFAMILSMGFSAFAYTDVAEGTKVAEAVGILSNLNILTGFEDGTFKPDETVTRAQMAAIICRTLGYEDQAQSSAGTTIFNDVAADHWASGYINVAQSLQIINGYGDGNYGPEDQVTYEQAVKMIVVALGYELDAQSKGGWSTGYLAVASREGITKNANGTVGSPAARGTVAVLVYNSLEVRLMDQEVWTTTGGEDEYGKTDETVLSQYLGVQKWEGIVYSTPFSEYAQKGYEADADAMMSLIGDTADENGVYAPFYQEYFEGKLYKYYEALEEVDCSLVADVNTLAGKKVIAYVGADEDDETGNRMVYAIAEKQGANKVTKLSATQLIKDGDKYWSDDKAEGVIAYKNIGSSRINTLDLDDEVSVVVNYGALDSVDVVKTSDLAGIFNGKGGSVELISNDANSKIDVILATVYAEDGEAVVEEVSTEDEMITFDCYKGSIEEYDTENEDVLAVVVKDGAIATVADIAANDTVSIVDMDKVDTFIVYYVSSKTVTGAVGSYDPDYVEIAGEEYELSPFASYNATSDLSGKEGIFFLNVDGQIAYDEAEGSKGNYAAILAVGASSGINAGWEVEAVLADGTVATYGLGTKAFIKGVQEDKNDEKTAAELYSIMTADGNDAWRIEEDALKNSIYEITVKNGKITKLVPLAIKSQSAGKDYDEENLAYGNVSFNDATVIFSIDEITPTEDKDDSNVKYYWVEADDVMVGTVSDFMVDGEGEDASIYSYDEDNNDIAGLVVGFGLSASIPRDGDALIVTGIKTKEIDNDEAYVVSGLQGGQKVTYTIYNADGDYGYDPSELTKGDVILTAAANAEGMVKKIEMLYDFDAEDGSTLDAIDDMESKKNEYYFAGTLDKTDANAPTDSKFFIDLFEVKEDWEEEGNDISSYEVTMRNSANFTLVDLTESKTNPDVTKKSKSKSIFGSLTKYNSEVFVRYYDDEIVEVVVYRTSAN